MAALRPARSSPGEESAQLLPPIIRSSFRGHPLTEREIDRQIGAGDLGQARSDSTSRASAMENSGSMLNPGSVVGDLRPFGKMLTLEAGCGSRRASEG